MDFEKITYPRILLALLGACVGVLGGVWAIGSSFLNERAHQDQMQTDLIMVEIAKASSEQRMEMSRAHDGVSRKFDDVLDQLSSLRKTAVEDRASVSDLRGEMQVRGIETDLLFAERAYRRRFSFLADGKVSVFMFEVRATSDEPQVVHLTTNANTGIMALAEDATSQTKARIRAFASAMRDEYLRIESQTSLVRERVGGLPELNKVSQASLLGRIDGVSRSAKDGAGRMNSIVVGLN